MISHRELSGVRDYSQDWNRDLVTLYTITKLKYVRGIIRFVEDP